MATKAIWGLLLLFISNSVMSKSAEQLSFKAADEREFKQLKQGFTQAFSANTASLLTPFYITKPCNNCQRYDSRADFGWGRLVVYSSKAKLLVQVPHRFYDRGTWQIAKQWRSHETLAALMVNTVHRYGEGRHSRDFSTAPNNAFLAAAEAFIATRPEGIVVQLHGFSRHKRKTAAGAVANVVLSYGRKAVRKELQKLTRMANCINKTFKVNVLVYPIEVEELGGTQNIIAKAFVAQGFKDRFIHIELDADFRAFLKMEKAQSMRLYDCISGGDNE